MQRSALYEFHTVIANCSRAVAVEDISGWGGAGMARPVWPRSVNKFLHYVMPSTEKCSRGTLGNV